MKHIQMPKALAEKWLSDLRSGKYKQCASFLKDEDETGIGYCCLGVLIESAGDIVNPVSAAGALPATSWLNSKKIVFRGSDSRHSNSPYISKEDCCVDFLNDNGMPFSQIADLLEQEIEYNDE